MSIADTIRKLDEQAAQQPQPETIVFGGPEMLTPTAPVEEDGPTLLGEVGRGAARGALQTTGLVAAGLSAAAKKGGADAEADMFMAGYDTLDQIAKERFPATIPSITDIPGDGIGETLSNAAFFAAAAVPEVASMFIIPGGGAAIGRAIATRGAMSLEKTLASKYMANLVKEVGEDKAKLMIAKRIGAAQTAGASAATYGTSVGEIYSSVRDETGEVNPDLALLAGIPHAALDVLPQMRVFNRIFGPKAADKIAKGLWKRMGEQGAKQFLSEGSTEGIQTIIEKGASMLQKNDLRPLDEQDWIDIADSVVKGGLGGATISVAAEPFNRSGLPPSDDPEVNEAERDISSREDEIAGEPDPADMEATPEQEAAFAKFRDEIKKGTQETPPVEAEVEPVVAGEEPKAGEPKIEVPEGQEVAFIPSREFQEVPEGIEMPEGGDVVVDKATDKSYIKWADPPAPVFKPIEQAAGTPENQSSEPKATILPEVGENEAQLNVESLPALEEEVKKLNAEFDAADENDTVKLEEINTQRAIANDRIANIKALQEIDPNSGKPTINPINTPRQATAALTRAAKLLEGTDIQPATTEQIAEFDASLDTQINRQVEESSGVEGQLTKKEAGAYAQQIKSAIEPYKGIFAATGVRAVKNSNKNSDAGIRVRTRKDGSIGLSFEVPSVEHVRAKLRKVDPTKADIGNDRILNEYLPAVIQEEAYHAATISHILSRRSPNSKLTEKQYLDNFVKDRMTTLRKQSPNLPEQIKRIYNQIGGKKEVSDTASLLEFYRQILQLQRSGKLTEIISNEVASDTKASKQFLDFIRDVLRDMRDGILSYARYLTNDSLTPGVIRKDIEGINATLDLLGDPSAKPQLAAIQNKKPKASTKAKPAAKKAKRKANTNSERTGAPESPIANDSPVENARSGVNQNEATGQQEAEVSQQQGTEENQPLDPARFVSNDKNHIREKLWNTAVPSISSLNDPLEYLTNATITPEEIDARYEGYNLSEDEVEIRKANDRIKAKEFRELVEGQLAGYGLEGSDLAAATDNAINYFRDMEREAKQKQIPIWLATHKRDTDASERVGSSTNNNYGFNAEVEAQARRLKNMVEFESGVNEPKMRPGKSRDWATNTFSKLFDRQSVPDAQVANELYNWMKNKRSPAHMAETIMNGESGLSGPAMITAAHLIQGMSGQYRRAVNASNLSAEEKISEVNRTNRELDKLTRWLAGVSHETANTLRWHKFAKMAFDGEMGVRDMYRGIMDAAERLQENLGQAFKILPKEEIALFITKIRGQALDRSTKKADFYAYIENLLKESAKDPAAFAQRVRRTLARRVNKQKDWDNIVRFAASESTKDGGEMHMRSVVNSIAADLVDGDKIKTIDEATKIVNNAMGDLVRQLHEQSQKGAKKKTKANATQYKRLEAFKALLSNDDVKQKFHDALAQQLGKKMNVSPSSKQFKERFGRLLNDFVSTAYTDRQLTGAMLDTMRMLDVSMSSLTKQTWGEGMSNIEQIKKKFTESMSGIPQDVIDVAVEKIDESLNNAVRERINRLYNIEVKTRKDGSQYVAQGENIRAVIRNMPGVYRSIRDATKLSQVGRENWGREISEAIINETGLPEEEAMRLQRKVIAGINAAMTVQEKDQIAAKLKSLENVQMKGTKEKADPKGVAEKLIEYANMGYLSEGKIYEAIRQQYKQIKMPIYSPKFEQFVRERGDFLHKLPDGRTKNEAIQSLTNEIQKMVPLSRTEMFKSMYYFNLLSGPSTQILNVGSNFMMMMSNASVWAAQNPKRLPKILRAVSQAFKKDSRSMTDFIHVLNTGLAPEDLNFKFPGNNPFEVANAELNPVFHQYANLKQNPDKAGWNPKTLMRLLKATDMFFRAAAQEAYYASQGGRTFETADMRSYYDKARQELIMFGITDPTETQIRRMAFDMFQEKREAENPWLASIASDKSLETTFNGKPKGMLGLLATSIQEMTQRAEKLLTIPGTDVSLPLMTFIVPFTNIVANVTNEQLNWTPIVGTFRAYAFDDWKIEKADGTLMRDPDIVFKSWAGTALTASIVAMAALQDDEDPWFQVFGPGPKDPNKRRQFYQAGNRPYSFKIGNQRFNYLVSPFAMPMAIVGNMTDAYRFDNFQQDDGFFQWSMYFLSSGFSATLDQSFLQGIQRVFGIADSYDPADSMSQILGGIVKSSFSPNLINQMVQTYDQTLYHPENFLGYATRGTPVQGLFSSPQINQFGEKVVKEEIPFVGRFWWTKSDDPVVQFLNHRGLWVPGFSQSTMLGNEKMTEAQLRQYIEIAGPEIKALIDNNMVMLQNMNHEDAQEWVSDMSGVIKRKARRILEQRIAQGLTPRE